MSGDTQPKNATPAHWLSLGRFGLVLAGLIFVAYPEVVLGQKTFFFRDFGYFGYPLAFHHKQAFLHGEIPLWNPLSNCGLPFLAQWNTLVLYPGSLLYLLFPLSWSLGFFCLVHQWVAGLGMFWLARRWTGSPLAGAVAGTGYAFGGLLLNSLMWPNNIAALAWMPWVIGAGERSWREGGRALVVAALLGALQMLAGAPEVILFTWVILGALCAGEFIARWRQRNMDAPATPLAKLPLRFSLLVLWVAGLAAIQLLPFLDLLTHSQRDTRYADAYGAMPGWGWANLLVPTFRCFTKFFGVIAQYDQYWTSSYYAGLAILALALVAVWRSRDPRVRVIGGLLLFGLVMALGENGLIYAWLRKLMPQSGYMRYPVKFVIIAAFCLPLLAAFGARRLWPENPDLDSEQPPATAQALRDTWLVAGGLIVLITGIAWFDWRYPIFQTNPFPAWQSGLTRSALLLVALGLAWFWPRCQTGSRGRILAVVIIAVFAVDGITHVPLQNPTMPLAGYRPGLLQLSPAPRLGMGRAMVSPAAEARMHQVAVPDPLTDYVATRAGLFVNSNLLDEYMKPDGLYSLYLRGTDRIHRVVFYGSTNLPPERKALLDFLGIQHLTAPGQAFAWEGRPEAMPLVTTGQRPVFLEDDPVFYLLGTSEFKPVEVVYLPPAARSLVAATTNVAAQVSVLSFKAGRIEMAVDSPAATVVTIAQAYYHRWEAKVDGVPAPLLRANYAFQAVPIPAGKHSVEVVYEDRAFQVGAAISLLALLAMPLAWRRSRIKTVALV